MEEQRLLKRKRKATLEKNTTLLCAVCTDLAELYVAEGRYQSAVEEYRTLAELYKNEKKLINYAQANRGIGEAYLGLHQFERALEYLHIYLDVAKTEQDKLEEQRALATIGHSYLSWYLDTTVNPDKNYLHKAFKIFMKSLIVCESLTNIGKLEKVDMTARLFCNLGVVQDCLGNFNKALELLTKSIQICKQHDIFEQLHRGYIAIASLYDKTGDYKNVIQNYNLAIIVAKKLRSKPELLCAALFSKAEALIKLGDFHGAKPVLYKAYKLNSPNLQDKKSIEHHLRAVAVICKTEDQLVVTCENQTEVKKLYEKLGDCACDLKNYKKAIDYYKKMLEAAEKSGVGKRELATCYYSLAQTYKDNEQYKEAVDYFEKEYAIVRDSLKDNLNTLSQIADAKESAGALVTEVKEVYERAFENCRQRKNLKEERRMVLRCLQYMRRSKNHSDAYHYEQCLNELENQNLNVDCSSSDSESVDSDAQIAQIEDEICLEDITDISDDSDNDNPACEQTAGKTSRPKRKRNIVVKNNKGETKLHLAAIKGNALAVQVLLDQGHPVNIRDHAGWLPLHEAANNGRLDVVRLLLDHGSAINDRGDTQGVTPLHDSAYNGHVDIMELLLDKGASAITMTDDGETPLNALRHFMQNNPIDSQVEDKYEGMVRRLTEAMEKTGQQIKPLTVKNQNVPSSLTAVSKEGERASQKRSFIDRNRSFVDDFDFSSTAQNTQDGGANEYREVMSTLKHKNNSANRTNLVNASETAIKRPALISSDEVWDDWLEDDMQSKNKKRKTGLSLEKKSPKAIQRSTPNKRISVDSSQSNEDYIVPDDFFDDFSNDNTDIINSTQTQERRTSNESRVSTGSGTSSKRKNQTSLLESGFSRATTPTNFGVTSSNKKRTPINNKNKPHVAKSKPFQLKLTNSRYGDSLQETTTTTVDLSGDKNDFNFYEKRASPVKNHVTSDPTLFVDVRIEGRLYRVPVLLSQVQTHTIKWLCEQAANRYASKEYMRPTLELETKSGAILADDDLLSLLFPMGSMQAEQVEARVLKWSLPPLIDRYRESCAHMETVQDVLLSKLAEEMSDVLNISNKGLRSATVAPLCKAINHQSNLLEINLSGNFLNTDCVKMLCASLGSLENLQKLNLSSTGLQAGHLSMIAQATSAQKRLECFDLSDNPLRNESLFHLRTITQNSQLTHLNVSGIGLKSDIDDITLNLSSMQDLDVSDNDLSTRDLKCLLGNLDAKVLKSVNMSRLRPNNAKVLQTLTEEVFKLEPVENLKVMKLSRCNIDDTELFNILWHHTKKLTTIDLSYNCDVTGLSLQRLLDHASLCNINLIGCKNIFRNFEFDVLFSGDKRERTIKMYVDDSQRIVNIFNNHFSDQKVVFDELPNFLSIKVLNCR
ncbi:unnamed protein product [Brassicogethes aeneus]|uniref:Tonsoku-like protein n=1 Tax=Brassicogethes aeneus TaxID=1431903 RepID=A0A9P0AVP7_BRAAE|nr:unnamed protein product [Brassicogethes aeneus]